MKLKRELYKKEQLEIMNKIISILDLDNNNSITLYNLDNDTNKQEEIMKLTPNIRKYFTYACIMGVREPTKTNRPWLSIIKHITKLKYKMISSDYRTIINDNKIRTKRYFFIKNNEN